MTNFNECDKLRQKRKTVKTFLDGQVQAIIIQTLAKLSPYLFFLAGRVWTWLQIV